MTCPLCGREPLSRRQYIWKRQSITLECANCRAKLRMAPKTEQTALLLLVGLGLAVAGLALGGTLLGIRSATVSGIFAAHTVLAIAAVFLFAVAIAVAGAYRVRCLLWSRPYVPRNP